MRNHPSDKGSRAASVTLDHGKCTGCTANAPNGAIRTCYAPAEPANRAENPLQTIPASARRSGNVGLQPRENPHTAGTFSRGTRGKCNLVSTFVASWSVREL